MGANRNFLRAGAEFPGSVADGGMGANRNDGGTVTTDYDSVADGGMGANRNKERLLLRPARV